MNVLFYIVVHTVTNVVIALVKGLSGSKREDKKD